MRSELCVVERDEQGSVYVWVQAHSFSRSALMRERGRKGSVKRSVRKGNDLVFDYDAEGNLFGIEILNVPERLSDKGSPRDQEDGAHIAPTLAAVLLGSAESLMTSWVSHGVTWLEPMFGP